MKKILFIISFLMLSVMIVACDTPTLATPTNLAISGRNITWSAVEGATGYNLKINTEVYDVEVTNYSLAPLVYGPIEVSVQAKNESLTSAYSSVLTVNLFLQLSVPANVRVSGNQILWDAVSQALGYTVRINGNEFAATTNSLEFDSSQNAIIEVRANGSLESYKTSSTFSSIYIYTAPVNELGTVSGLMITDEVLTFDAVENATSYKIYVNGELYTTISTTTYDIPAELLLDLDAYLQVAATALGYQDGDLSSKIFINSTDITTEAELKAMNNEGRYTLKNDIALTTLWVPLDFSGVLDGQGFTISNIAIEADTTQVGFFGILENATIVNLNLVGSISHTYDSHAPRIGAVAGTIKTSTLDNVSADFTIVAESNNGIGYLGGIAGQIENSNLELVSFEGDIVSTHFVTGGFVGVINNPSVVGKIYQSKAVADLLIEGGEQSIAGGFVGQMLSNTMTIEQSYYDGDVEGTSYVGGFVGYMGSGNIKDSYSKGTLAATNDTLVHAGGFIGRLEGYNSRISGSIAMMSVTVNQTGANIFKGAFVGHTVQGSFGGNIYASCYYDNALSSLDRIGNASTGRGDGISGHNFTTSEPTMSASIWTKVGSTFRLNWDLV